MIVHPTERQIVGDRIRISAAVEFESSGRTFTKSGKTVQELWIDWPAEYADFPEDRADPMFLICLTLAMCVNERIVVHSSLSQATIVNALEAMAIYETYFPKMCTTVDIEAQGQVRPKPQNQRVASFYSGGVDSLYNIAESKRLNLKYGAPAVSDLWLIQGMDIRLSDSELWERTKANVFAHLQADDPTGLADIRTNARDLHSGIVGWEELGFSVILGGIAKCFAHDVPSVLIGSYGKYSDIIPHASSPLVDHMWSCDQQSVRHFSCRADRQEKIETIATLTPHLLGGLRVCYRNTGGAYNCGVCEKCMRTQAQLLIGGYGSLADTFEQPLTAETLRYLKLPWKRKNSYTWDFWQKVEYDLGRIGAHQLKSALSKALTKNRIQRSLKQLTSRS